MSGGWTRKKLGDAFTTMTGGTPSKADASLFGTYIPLVKPPELLDGTLDSAEDGLSESGARCARTLPADSVLVSCIGNLGKVGLNTVPVAFNQQINAVLPDRAAAMPEFMFYQALSPAFRAQLEALATGTTVRIVNKSKFNEIEIVLAPLSEQHRIVTILDEAFEAIATAKANAEKSLQQIGELFEYAMHLLVEQPGVPIAHLPMADVCEIRSKLVDPREEPYLDQLHVGAANIVSKTGELVDVLTARQEQLISGKFEFDDSMVLYSKIRPYLMKVVRPDFSGLCSADIYPLMPKPGVISRDFLYYTLLSSAFTDYAIKGSARAGMPKVNRDHLFAYQMSLPPVEVQGQITRKLDSLADNVESMQGIYARKLAALAELKKSLLHQAFSGQL